MTLFELLNETYRGRLLLVGEYRGSKVEKAGYVDKKSGEAIHYVRVIHLIESACIGSFDSVLLYQRLSVAVEDFEKVIVPYLKGRRYVFFLAGFKVDRGLVSGSLAERLPELIEENETVAGVGLALPLPSGGASLIP